MILSATLSGLAHRFRLIVDGLRKVVPEHQTKNPDSCALVGVIWTSLGRRLERFGRILARVEAGIPDPVWPSRAGRPAARAADATTDTAPARKLRLPTRVGWLMVMMPWVVAPYGTQLRHWLTDPDAETLVRSSRRMRRLLRPLLRSLSTDPLPACLLEPVTPPETGPAGDGVKSAGSTLPTMGKRSGRPNAAPRSAAATINAALPPAMPSGTQPGEAASPRAAATAAACGWRTVPVEPSPANWCSVQDQRRQAALAIARGSVCRA